MKMQRKHIEPFRVGLKARVSRDWQGLKGQLASEANISAAYLSEIIGSLKKVPSQKVAEQLAKACGVSFTELINEGLTKLANSNGNKNENKRILDLENNLKKTERTNKLAEKLINMQEEEIERQDKEIERLEDEIEALAAEIKKLKKIIGRKTPGIDKLASA